MRMGRVQLRIAYEVDLDNKDHVEVAKGLLHGCLDTEFDVGNEFEEFINGYIEEVEDSSLTPNDIPREIFELSEGLPEVKKFMEAAGIVYK
jgi:hypothetical protein